MWKEAAIGCVKTTSRGTGGVRFSTKQFGIAATLESIPSYRISRLRNSVVYPTIRPDVCRWISVVKYHKNQSI